MSNAGNLELEGQELVTEIANICSDAKGIDITILDVSKVFNLANHFIVVSGRSDRHVQGISNRLIDDLKDKQVKPLLVEGIEEGQWVLLDYNDVIVHVFYAPVREHYDIEGLWLKAQKLELHTSSQSGKIELIAA